MQRGFIILLFLLLTVAVGLTFYGWMDKTPAPSIPRISSEVLSFNAVSSPELAQRAEDSFERARSNMVTRFSNAGIWRSAKNWLDIAALVIGAILTVLGGWYGRAIVPDNGVSGNLEQIGTVNRRSRWHIRLLSCGLAIVVALNALGNRCGAFALESAARANELADHIRQSRLEFDKAGDDSEREAALLSLDKATMG